MTNLELWLKQARRADILLRRLRDDGASATEQEKACKAEFRFGLRVAQQRLKVARILEDRGITAAEVGDLDPSKLRSLGKTSLPPDRDKALKMIRGLKAQTNQQLNDTRRKDDMPTLRLTIAACVTRRVTRRGQCFEVALATERQRGQLMLVPDETWNSIEEVVAFVRGASWPVGHAWIVADGLSSSARKILEERAGLPDRRVTVRRASGGGLPLTISQRRKASARLSSERSARSAGAANDSDLTEAAFSKMGWRPRTDLKERPLAARAALVLALSRLAPGTLAAT